MAVSSAEIVQHERRRDMRFILAMIPFLMFAVLYLWNEVRTLNAWNVKHSGQILALEKGQEFANAMDRQSLALEKIEAYLAKLAEEKEQAP